MNNFIKKLDRKLHYQRDAEYCGHPYKHDCFTIIEKKDKPDRDVKMTLSEYKKLVSLIEEKENKLIIVPCSPGFGFIAGFSVYTYAENVYVPPFDEDDYDARQETMFTFTDRILVFTKAQLPDGIVYKDLEKVVKTEENLKLLKYYGFDEVYEEGHYDY